MTPPHTPRRPWVEAQTFLERDGMTQTTLARETGFSASYINDLIRGRRTPNGRVISRVAAVLKVPKSMLIPATEEAA